MSSTCLTIAALICCVVVGLINALAYGGSSSGTGNTGSTGTGGMGSGNTGTGSVNSTGSTVSNGTAIESGVVCHTTPTMYSLTGEALYRQVLTDWANGILNIYNIWLEKSNVPANNQSGFFFGAVLLIGHSFSNLRLLQDSPTLNFTGPTCLSFNQELGQDLTQIFAHVNDTISGGACSSLTGEAHYQYILQDFGVRTNQVLNTAAALPPSSSLSSSYSGNSLNSSSGTGNSTGQWASLLQQFPTAVNIVNTILANNDSSQNCVTQTLALSQYVGQVIAQTINFDMFCMCTISFNATVS